MVLGGKYQCLRLILCACLGPLVFKIFQCWDFHPKLWCILHSVRACFVRWEFEIGLGLLVGLKCPKEEMHFEFSVRNC